jgi:hypothetical protein
MTSDITSADVPIQAAEPPAPQPSKSAATPKKFVANKKSSKRNQPVRGNKKSATPKPDSTKAAPAPTIDQDEEDFRSAHSGGIEQDPDFDPEPSDSEDSSSTSEEVPEETSSSEDGEGDLPTYRQFKGVPDPFSTRWYQQRQRTYTEETLQVPVSHRNNYPRPFVIRDAEFNRTLSTCSTGAKQEAEVLYTLASFGALRLNQCHDFLENHPKLKGEVRDHLEEGWLYQLGLYEYTLARLDIIEGLQGDSQAQALAQIQQARVHPLLGRGNISSETY